MLQRDLILNLLVAALMISFVGCPGWSRWQQPHVEAGHEHEPPFPAGLPADLASLEEQGGNHRRAAAWLQGGVEMLASGGDGEGEARAMEWFRRSSALDPGPGGAGEIARTLLDLIASIKREQAASKAAKDECAAFRSANERMKVEVEEMKQEIEGLKAIDLAPLPGEEAQ